MFARRHLIVVSLILSIVLLIVACTPAPTPAPPAATSAPVATSAPTRAPAAASPAATSAPAATSPAATSAPSGQKVSEIKIGVLYPLTGSSAQSGNDAKAAVELAADILNGKYKDAGLPFPAIGMPGLGGAQVTVVFADQQGKAEVGQSEAERLINGEKVIALYGAYNSAVTKTSSNVAERVGIPYVNGESSSPDLTERSFKWFFRTSPNDLDFSKAMFDYLDALNKQKNANIKTVGLLYEDTDFGVNSATAEKAEAKRIGVNIAGDVKYKAGTTSLSAEIQTLKAANADVLIPSSYSTDVILTMKTMKDLDYNPKLILAQDAGYVDSTFIPTLTKDAEGVASRAAFSLDIVNVKPIAKKVNDLYKAKTNKDLTDIPARAFTGFMTLAEAINRAGSTDPAKIRQALVATDVPTDQTIMPWKGIKFDDKGQNQSGAAIIIQVQSGAYKTIFPLEFKNADSVFPIPKWSDRK